MTDRITRQGGGREVVDYSRLGTLLDEQDALFRRLHALSSRQRALVEDEETDELIGVLRARQGVIAELGVTTGELAPYRARWDELLAAAPPALADRFRERVRSTTRLAELIAETDEHDRRQLAERRDTLAQELAGVDNGRGAMAAYSSKAARPGPRFQDTEG